MSWYKFFICLIILFLSYEGFAVSEDIDAFWEYDVFYLNETQNPRLKISARLKNVTGIRSVFLLPSYALSNECMIKRDTEIKVTNGLKTEFIKDKCLLAVDHEDGSDIIFEYYLTTQMADIFPHPTPFGLVVTDESFYFCGRNLFLGLNTENIQMMADIKWHLPSFSSKIVNSYGFKKEQKIIAPQKEFLSSGFVGGKVSRKKIAPNLYLVTDDLNKLNSKDITSFIKNKVSALKKFWQDEESSGNYIVSIFEKKEQTSGTDGFFGIALNKFVGMFFYNIKEGINNPDVAMLTTHELIHKWIGNMGMLMVYENMLEQTWFNEGMTDYYAANLNLQQDGNLLQYLDNYNKLILYHYTRIPSSNAMVKYLEIYHIGRFLASNLNYHIKLHSNNLYSLDNVMIDLYESVKGSSDRKISLGDFIRVGNKYWGGFEDYINSKMSKNNTYSFDDGQFGQCVHLTTKYYKKAEYGLDYVASLTYNVISGVREGTKLYKAGIRNGQKIISNDDVIDKESPGLPIRITVETEHGNKTIVLEREGELVSVPVFVLDKEKYNKNPSICLKYLELISK